MDVAGKVEWAYVKLLARCLAHSRSSLPIFNLSKSMEPSICSLYTTCSFHLMASFMIPSQEMSSPLLSAIPHQTFKRSWLIPSHQSQTILLHIHFLLVFWHSRCTETGPCLDMFSISTCPSFALSMVCSQEVELSHHCLMCIRYLGRDVFGWFNSNGGVPLPWREHCDLV